MKTFNINLNASKIVSIVVLVVLGMGTAFAQELDINKKENYKPETELPPEIYWDVKAYIPEAKLIKVKAVDSEGNIFAIKALQSYIDTSILDVKCLYNNEILPVKVVLGTNTKALKAIKEDGSMLDVKAITEDGKQYAIHSINRTGNVVNIRVMDGNGGQFKIFAISPEGHVNDVKGIKMMREDQETVIHGVKVYAHVKALTQI